MFIRFFLLSSYFHLCLAAPLTHLFSVAFKIKFCNDEYLKLTKYSHDEIFEKPIFDFVDEESLENIEQILQLVKSGELYQDVFKGKPKYGEPFYTKTTIISRTALAIPSGSKPHSFWSSICSPCSIIASGIPSLFTRAM